MILIRNLAFIQIHKTGSTAVEKLLLSHPEAIKHTKHTPASHFKDNDYIFLAACREPLAYYLSLFFFSCMAEKGGGLRGELTLPFRRKLVHLGWRQKPITALSLALNHISRDRKSWQRILNTPQDVSAFHEFVTSICMADKIRSTREGLFNSPHLGFYSNRHIRMSCRDPGSRSSLSQGDALDFMVQKSLISHLIPVERLGVAIPQIYASHDIELKPLEAANVNSSRHEFSMDSILPETVEFISSQDHMMKALHVEALSRY